MKTKKQPFKLFLNRIPLIGILCFTILFIYSATLYPGGSQADLNAIGFDWINNYWCNLMNKNGMNGAANPARSFAIVAMIILCNSLTIFFIQFAEFLTQTRRWKMTIQFGGILAMIFATLMFTKYHDLMTIISSFFGLFAVLGIIKEIYGSQLFIYKVTGVICLFFLGLNNLIYYTQEGIEWLPLIQKITFIVVLLWIIGLNQEIRKKII